MDKVPTDYRDELRHWIDEDASARDIWGRKPSWQNLKPVPWHGARPVKIPMQTCVDLHFVVTKAHWGDRQGYTLYIPKALVWRSPRRF